MAGSLLQCRSAPVCSRALEGAFDNLPWICLTSDMTHESLGSLGQNLHFVLVSKNKLCDLLLSICIYIYSVNCILLFISFPSALQVPKSWGRLRPGLLRCFREWPGPVLCRQRPSQWSPGGLGSCTELCWSYGLCRCQSGVSPWVRCIVDEMGYVM